MDGQRARISPTSTITIPAARVAESSPVSPVVATPRRWTLSRPDAADSLLLGLGWLVGFVALMLLDPIPQPDFASIDAMGLGLPTPPAWVSVAQTAMIWGLFATWGSSVVRGRITPIAGLFAGFTALGLHLYCGFGGHIAMTNGFWQAQLAVVGVMTVASVAVLGRNVTRA